MKSDAESDGAAEFTSAPLSWPRETARRDRAVPRRQDRDLARQYPRFLIRLVGEECLRRLPAEALAPLRYD